jgi:tetratricopeptide (TPR) repeat protein
MSPTLQSEFDNGTRLLQAGRFDEAQQLANSLLQRYPGHPDVHLFAADTASLSGDRKGAIRHLESLPTTGSASARVLLRKAQLQFNDSQRAAALATTAEAAALAGDDERQLRAIARILSDCQQLDEARRWLLQVLERLPGSIPVLFDLAVTEFHLNLPREALQHIDTLLGQAPLHPGALHLRSALATQTAEHNHIEDLQQRLESGAGNPNLVTAACYALAKEYEDLGQYPASFAALSRGAAAYRGILRYDSAEELAAHEQIRTGFTREVIEALSPGLETDAPIFIVGMPRTGTTLVERLLSAHSQVSSIGEFRDFPMMLTDLAARALPDLPAGATSFEASVALDFRQLGQDYLSAARQVAGDSPRFVDKLPYNFLYCGYIAAALPDARIIHLTRDPMDTCYAVFKTLFFSAYSFSYDQQELADYFISYHRMMRHWHDVLPGRILDVGYEHLVRDPQGQAQEILRWCGLPWEEAVLAFHEQDAPATTASAMQVRQPMHTESVDAWRRVGEGLEPLRQKLREAGLVAD